MRVAPTWGNPSRGGPTRAFSGDAMSPWQETQASFPWKRASPAEAEPGGSSSTLSGQPWGSTSGPRGRRGASRAVRSPPPTPVRRKGAVGGEGGGELGGGGPLGARAALAEPELLGREIQGVGAGIEDGQLHGETARARRGRAGHRGQGGRGAMVRGLVQPDGPLQPQPEPSLLGLSLGLLGAGSQHERPSGQGRQQREADRSPGPTAHPRRAPTRERTTSRGPPSRSAR